VVVGIAHVGEVGIGSELRRDADVRRKVIEPEEVRVVREYIE
jgi:hypothetical protein